MILVVVFTYVMIMNTCNVMNTSSNVMIMNMNILLIITYHS